MNTPLLDQVHTPADLTKLDQNGLVSLCTELRNVIADTVAKNGGHLASNLGAVELTVCLDRVFSAPGDQIVFDVGHQCYTHKLLTGRRELFAKLRQKDGAAGFPRPGESSDDAFIGGHSSTSVSAALGLATAKMLRSQPGDVVAVIGDGAMTGGQFFEALNNVAGAKTKVVIVINDNEMSIAPNIGGISDYLSRLTSRRSYFAFKDRMERFLRGFPLLGDHLFRSAVRLRNAVKRVVTPPTIFNDMGIAYIGPVDGHDVDQLLTVFERAKKLRKSVVVHCRTVKGKGFTYAEHDPSAFHSTAPFEVETGVQTCRHEDYSAVFGQTLCEMAETDDRICAVSASMLAGTGLSAFAARFPKRTFDVAIAEQHAVTFSAALAKGGMRPYFAVYSSFLQRGYDQILHDAAILSLPVVFCVDRAGLVGADGETHQGLFDIAFLGSVPGMTVFSPSCYEELRLCLRESVHVNAPIAIRYPRGCEEDGCSLLAPCKDFLLDKQNSDILLVTYGSTAAAAAKAAAQLRLSGVGVDLLKLVQVKPIPLTAIRSAAGYRTVLFFEEAVRSGSVGAAFCEAAFAEGFRGTFRHIAVDDVFVSQDTVAAQRRRFGLDCDGIVAAVKQEIREVKP